MIYFVCNFGNFLEYYILLSIFLFLEVESIGVESIGVMMNNLKSKKF